MSDPEPSSTGNPKRAAPLTEQRIALLNDLGFTWTLRSRETTIDEVWRLRLDELKAFKRIHGHCLVPARYDANPELGVWVATQRTQYRVYMKAKEDGTFANTAMNDERILELEQLGFAWGLRSGRAGARGDLPTMEDAVAAAEAAVAAVEAAGSVIGDPNVPSASSTFDFVPI